MHSVTCAIFKIPTHLRMGFEFINEAPPIHGVPYGIYAKQLIA